MKCVMTVSPCYHLFINGNTYNELKLKVIIRTLLVSKNNWKRLKKKKKNFLNYMQFLFKSIPSI